MKRSWFLTGLVILAGCAQLESPAPQSAFSSRTTHNNQDITAYAMGGIPAGGGGYANIGIVAVHPSEKGNISSAPLIPYEELVEFSEPIIIPDKLGVSKPHYYFVVKDKGDPNYLRSQYWLDVHFGRFIQNDSDPCSCPGVVTPPGTCQVAKTNSCENAKYFGVPKYSYSY